MGSQELEDLLALCLTRQPEARPSAAQLLHHRLFKQLSKHAQQVLLLPQPSPIRGCAVSRPNCLAALDRELDLGLCGKHVDTLHCRPDPGIYWMCLLKQGTSNFTQGQEAGSEHVHASWPACRSLSAAPCRG